MIARQGGAIITTQFVVTEQADFVHSHFAMTLLNLGSLATLINNFRHNYLCASMIEMGEKPAI